MRMYDLIMKKRNGMALTEHEIDEMIDGYTKGEIPDYQMSAFTMAVFFQGMNKEETLALTMAMARSGDMLDLSDIVGIKVDKHSTGGVGDKTSLCVIPLLASFGLVTAKMSGRGLGHTGGTVDKLECFSGFHTELSKDRFLSQIKDIGIAIVGQSADLAPADKKLYALRDVTATVENISLIASSIMSKKLAADADIILLDVKTGSGAFMKTLDDSKALAKAMVEIGKGAGKETIAVISDMDEPLGYAVGNALEVTEAIHTLRGYGPKDFTDLVYALVSQVLLATNIAVTEDDAIRLISRKIESGEALAKLAKFVVAQGGKEEEGYNPDLLPQALHEVEIPALDNGRVYTIQCEEIGLCSMMLGGGRAKKEDIIDPAVGFILHKKVGDSVEVGDSLATMYYNSDDVPIEVVDRFINAYHIEDCTPAPKVLIYDVIQ